jgi:hypothetical protein
MDKEAPIATVQTAQAGLASARADKTKTDKNDIIFNILDPLSFYFNGSIKENFPKRKGILKGTIIQLFQRLKKTPEGGLYF